MSEISISNVLERRPIMIGGRDYPLRLVGISEIGDGGATVTIAVVGTPHQLQLNASTELLEDPIALRLRAAYFVRQMMTGRVDTNAAVCE